MATQQIPPDQILLVQHARERPLRANPEEALKWCNRAKFAMAETPGSTDPIPNREEVRAVWEYLGRTIDVSTIVQVFEKMRIVPHA